MLKVLKVLLVSPTDPDPPIGGPSNLKFLMGGENTYTKTLLANPPKGIQYIHHLEAAKKGLIEYLPIQKILANLVKFRILPLSSGTQTILVKNKFDLIHVHTYSLKVEGSTVPVVMSDSSSNYLFLRDYLGWPEWRIKAGLILRKSVFSKLGVLDPDTNLEKVSKLIVFSEFAKKIHQSLGAAPDKIEVIYPGLPKMNFKKKKTRGEVNILFVGTWFERKGGPILLEAFRLLFKKFPNLRLTIVGPIPKKFRIDNLPIFQRDFVPREKLLVEFFTKADIFVLVPPKAEGYGFVVAEAASFGILAIVSRVYALPELVEDGETGFVIKPGSVSELVEKLEILIGNKKLREQMGKAALKRFETHFTAEISNQKLLKVYQEAKAF